MAAAPPAWAPDRVAATPAVSAPTPLPAPNVVSRLRTSLLDQQPGRVLVRVFVNGQPLPFSGLTDPGGYFFIPLIPAGQPFTAVAVDTATGATRTTEGIGPLTGESVVLLFDFLSDDNGNGTDTIELDSNTTGFLTDGEIDFLLFEGTAGQVINLGLVNRADDTIIVNVIAPSGNALTFLNVSTSQVYFESGVFTLPETGNYLIEVGGGTFSPVGSYTLGLRHESRNPPRSRQSLQRYPLPRHPYHPRGPPLLQLQRQ